MAYNLTINSLSATFVGIRIPEVDITTKTEEFSGGKTLRILICFMVNGFILEIPIDFYDSEDFVDVGFKLKHQCETYRIDITESEYKEIVDFIIGTLPELRSKIPSENHEKYTEFINELCNTTIENYTKLDKEDSKP
jgi:hypothetical protein